MLAGKSKRPTLVRRLRREFWLLAGLTVAVSIARIKGNLFRYAAVHIGPDADEHLNGIVAMVRPDFIPFPRTRNPIYGVLIGWWESGEGLVATSVTASSIGVLATLVATALIGRKIGSAWVGGVAAVAASLMVPLTQAAGWTHPYPLTCGIGALGLAAALHYQARPSLITLLSAVWLGGWAIALDGRSIVFAAGAVLAVAAAKQALWRRACAIAVLGLGLVAGQSWQTQWRAHLKEETASLIENLDRQRGVILSEISGSGVIGSPNKPGPDVKAACHAEARQKQISIAQMQPECSRALLIDNLRALGETHLLPPPNILALLPLILLYRPGRRRDAWNGAIVIGLPALTLTLWSALVWIYPRYLLFMTPALSLLIPLSAKRLADLLEPLLGRRIQPFMMAAALLLIWQLWPHFPPKQLTSTQDNVIKQSELYREVRTTLRPGDQFCDATRFQLERQWAPKLVRRGPLSGERCHRYQQEQPRDGVTHWLLLANPKDRPTSASPDWQLERTITTEGRPFQLWKRR